VGQAICPKRSHPQQAKQLDNQCSLIQPNKPPPAQPREDIWGLTPAPRRLPAAWPPQPREGSPASNPNTGPGAEGGGGWPMHATAQPWHAQDGRRRPEPCGGCSPPGNVEELHQQDAPVGAVDGERAAQDPGPMATAALARWKAAIVPATLAHG
jgi:hypothetical protein